MIELRTTPTTATRRVVTRTRTRTRTKTATAPAPAATAPTPTPSETSAPRSPENYLYICTKIHYILRKAPAYLDELAKPCLPFDRRLSNLLARQIAIILTISIRIG